MSVIKDISRIHGYFSYKHFLKHSQYWPEDKRNAYVVDRLRRTLVRAAHGSTYYRDLFRDSGFDPVSDFKDPSDLARIPLLTKDQARSHADAMTDRRFALGSISLHTSGTTGEPLHYRWGEYQLAFDSACVFRHWSWAGYRFRAPMVALRSYVPERDSQPLWRYSRSQNTLYFSAYHLTPSNCQEYIEQILKFGPEFIKGYPSSVMLLAEYTYPIRERFESLRGIFTASETLLPTERETIEATFGKKLFNWYGMGEPAVVFTECEQHEGMHLNWEYGYAEFLPADDLGSDEYRLVTSAFHNPVMPFIRYETGDVVRLFPTPQTCSCGRNLPLIHSISGRKDECIITPDGRRLPSVNFYTVFRKYAEIAKWQIVQYGRSEVVAKVAVREPCQRESLETRLADELRVRTGQSVSLSIEFTDRFVRNSDGKTLPIARKLAGRSIEEKEEYAVSSQMAWQLAEQGNAVHKLDWNEADRVPSARVQEALVELIARPHSICWYPEAASLELRKALARYAAVEPDNVVLSHGSDLAMELVATSCLRPGDKALLVSPTYDNFRAVAEQRGADVNRFEYLGDKAFPTSDFVQVVRDSAPRLVYLVNPNNPIGYVLERAVIQKILAACVRLSTILVVDEAYFEFAGTSVAALAAASRYMIVLRTFSKAFGLAGLRLGYLVAGPELVRVLHRVHNPKSITAFAKTAARAALEDVESMWRYVAEVRKSRDRLCTFLKQQAIYFYPSQANFVLLQHDHPDKLVRYLESRNILVRDRTRYFAGVGHVRITLGGQQSTDALMEALADYFARPGIGQADAREESEEPKAQIT